MECYKLTALLGEREGERTTGGRGVEPQKTEFSLAGNKGPGQRHLSLPPPSRNPKGNQFLSLNLLAQYKHPMLCFYGSIPLTGLPAPDLVLQYPSRRSVTTKRTKSALPPLCTLHIHPG